MTAHDVSSPPSAAVGDPPRRFLRRIVWILLLWAGIVATASATGLLLRLPFPAIAFLAPLVIVPVALYYWRPAARDAFAAWGLRPLTALHIWRIAAALAFFWYGAQGQLSPLFVNLAAWGDLLAGSLALLVTLLPARRRNYLAFHVIGTADFVVAVSTGTMLALQQDPAMQSVMRFPLALIPLFGVAVSAITHVIAFDLLARRRGLPPEG